MYKKCLIILLTALTMLSAETITMEKAVALALTKNEDLLTAGKELEKSGSVYKEAFSGALPKIEGKVTALRSLYSSKITNMNYAIAAGTGVTLESLGVISAEENQNYQGGLTKSMDTDVNALKDNTVSCEVNLIQPIWLGGKVGAALEIAKIYTSMNQSIYELKKTEVVTSVKKSFYTVLMLRELNRVLTLVKADADSNLANLENMNKVGLVSEYDLIKGRVRIKSLEPKILEAANNLSLAESFLKSSIGMDINEKADFVGDFSENLVYDNSNYLQKVLENRKELQILGYKKDMLSKNRQIEFGNHLPSILAIGNYTFQSQNDDYGKTFDKNYGVHALSVGITGIFPIFNGFGTEAKVEQAEIEVKKTGLEIDKSKRLLQLQADQAYKKILEAKSEISLHDASVAESEKAQRIAKVRFENGAGTQIEVIDSQTAVEQAKVERISSVYKLINAVLDFEMAVGK